MRAPSLALPLLLAATLAAGCLGGSEPGPDEGNESTSGTIPVSTTPPPANETPPGNATNGTHETPAQQPPAPGFRTLARGYHSVMPYPLRLVITDAEEWRTFWREHHGNATGEPPAAPEVDFTRERAVVVTLGDKPDGCWHVRVTGVKDEGNGTTAVEVTTHVPDPSTGCTLAVTQPYVMVAIPNDGTEVAFRDVEKVGPPTK